MPSLEASPSSPMQNALSSTPTMSSAVRARLLVMSAGTLALILLTFTSMIRFQRYSPPPAILMSTVSYLPSRAVLNSTALKRSCRLNGGQLRRVLVTGAAGFIGSQVAKALWKRGDGVVGVDNFNEYYPVSLKRARVASMEDVYVVRGDILDKPLLDRLVEVCGVTHIVHLAAQAGVRYAQFRPLEYVRSNVDASVTVFEVARLAQPSPRVIYASTSSVYGDNEHVPFSEEDRADNPVSLYAATKRAVELTAHVYYTLYGLSVTGLRFFTVYGPWGRPDMAYFSFARNIMNGERVKIFVDEKNGEMARDFTYIDDIVAGILGAMDSSKPSEQGKAEYRIFNIGNMFPVSVSKFVETLENALGKSAIKTKVKKGNTGDVHFTHANITAAQNAFGYSPKTSLDQGLKNFAHWFYEYYGPDGMNLREDEINYKPY